MESLHWRRAEILKHRKWCNGRHKLKNPSACATGLSLHLFDWKISCNRLISTEIGLILCLKKSNWLHTEQWLKFHESGCAGLLTTHSTSAVVFSDGREVKDQSVYKILSNLPFLTSFNYIRSEWLERFSSMWSSTLQFSDFSFSESVVILMPSFHCQSNHCTVCLHHFHP